MEKYDPFRKLLGIEVHEVKDGYARSSITVTKEHMNIHGVAHGGVIFSLADCAFAEATNFRLQGKAVAIQVSINFIKPGKAGETLIAEATRVSEGQTFSLYSIAVSSQNTILAFFTGLAFKQRP